MRAVSRVLFFVLSCLPLAPLFGEAVIGSAKDKYYSALELLGIADSNTLNYRTYSDSASVDAGKGPWRTIGAKADRSGDIHFSAIGPWLFSSYNTAYPHGGNDGALWQGVGGNTSLFAGVSFDSPFVKAKLAPVFIFAENRRFAIMPSVLPDSDGYGYFWAGVSIDRYQRPGDSYLLDVNWGESEIRLDWNNATLGFGTQSAWLGPGQLNAIMLSNNAAPFPKFDIGLRRTQTRIGVVEGRALVGWLRESDFFDNDPGNDQTILSLASISWRPSFLNELTIGFNRSLIANADGNHLDNALKLFQWMGASFGKDAADQRASLTFRYHIPEAGFDAYLEWAKNDYSPNLDYLMRYPFHAHAYTIGARKGFLLESGSMIVATIEVSNTESSRDYELLWPTTFYNHHIVSHGYTNRGQIIGASIGSGGNSQFFGIDWYTDHGSIGLNLQRVNRDNDYVYFLRMGESIAEKIKDASKYNAELTAGINGSRFLTRSLRMDLGLSYCLNMNPLYNPKGNKSALLHNLYIVLGIEWHL